MTSHEKSEISNDIRPSGKETEIHESLLDYGQVGSLSLRQSAEPSRHETDRHQGHGFISRWAPLRFSVRVSIPLRFKVHGQYHAMDPKFVHLTIGEQAGPLSNDTRFYGSICRPDPSSSQTGNESVNRVSVSEILGPYLTVFLLKVEQITVITKV